MGYYMSGGNVFGFIRGSMYRAPSRRRGRARGRRHYGYYPSGGFFSFLKKAVGFVNPVTNPLVRSISRQLLPMARQFGFGKVADIYEQFDTVAGGALNDEARPQEEAVEVGGDQGQQADPGVFAGETGFTPGTLMQMEETDEEAEEAEDEEYEDEG